MSVHCVKRFLLIWGSWYSDSAHAVVLWEHYPMKASICPASNRGCSGSILLRCVSTGPIAFSVVHLPNWGPTDDSYISSLIQTYIRYYISYGPVCQGGHFLYLFKEIPRRRRGISCYNQTGTSLVITIVSSVTAHSTARTVTPAAEASLRAWPKWGSVASLGWRYFTSDIWITKST